MVAVKVDGGGDTSRRRNAFVPRCRCVLSRKPFTMERRLLLCTMQ